MASGAPVVGQRDLPHGEQTKVGCLNIEMEAIVGQSGVNWRGMRRVKAGWVEDR